MATAYTSNLRLALPTQGELTGSWGDTVNDSITSMIEEAIAGMATINTWTTNAHTLTTANGSTDESRAAILYLTDTTTDLGGAGQLIVPAVTKVYVVNNDTGQTITVKTSGGSGVAISDGYTNTIYCDGTDVLPTSSLFVTATTSTEGVIELATQAEVTAGTDAQRAVTPDTLNGYAGTLTSLSELEAVQFTEAVAQLTGTTVSIDCSTGNYFYITLTGATTFSFTNVPSTGSAYSCMLEVTQDGSSAYALTYPAAVLWAGGTQPTDPAISEVDLIRLVTRDGGTTWYGFQDGDAMA